ncbi:hypothetical protein GGR52DRAFT_470345 [Hypoxylon sp. FL1284]|nr:hypothetical protein GGR52DRAFT_470345 [Hypoxylon sp. FL1284]
MRKRRKTGLCMTLCTCKFLMGKELSAHRGESRDRNDGLRHGSFVTGRKSRPRRMVIEFGTCASRVTTKIDHTGSPCYVHHHTLTKKVDST